MTPPSSPAAAAEFLPPLYADVPYGPHERNVLDLWPAEPDEASGPGEPTPLLVHIHGGGFRGGDKRSLSLAQLRAWLDAGISVAAINYRLSQHAPYPAPMLDSARAIQFLRSRADEWHLDPQRVGATGGSAGGGISLWLGFHGDLADLTSDDPVARQSTRLACMLVRNAQSSYDLRVIRQLIPGLAWRHPALIQLFALAPDQVESPPPEKLRLFEDASPLTHLQAGAPPVYMTYQQENVPLPPDADEGRGIHHPAFGVALQERMAALGLECVVRCGPQSAGDDAELDFLKRHLGAPRPADTIAAE